MHMQYTYRILKVDICTKLNQNIRCVVIALPKRFHQCSSPLILEVNWPVTNQRKLCVWEKQIIPKRHRSQVRCFPKGLQNLPYRLTRILRHFPCYWRQIEQAYQLKEPRKPKNLARDQFKANMHVAKREDTTGTLGTKWAAMLPYSTTGYLFIKEEKRNRKSCDYNMFDTTILKRKCIGIKCAVFTPEMTWCPCSALTTCHHFAALVRH